MEIKQDYEQYSSDVLYDIFYGGYITPEEALADDEDIATVKEAIAVVRLFVDSLEDHPGFEVG